MFLMKTEEKINAELQKIITMRNDGYDCTMLKNDLSTELDIFHNVLDLNALKKVMLKGEIGIYRSDFFHIVKIDYFLFLNLK